MNINGWGKFQVEETAKARQLIAGSLAFPAHFGRRAQGGYPRIREQGSCESVRAFATVRPLGRAIRMKDPVAIDLSKQRLLNWKQGQWSCQIDSQAWCRRAMRFGDNMSRGGDLL